MELLRTWLGHPEDIYNLLRFKMGGYRVVMPRIDPVRGRGCPGARPRGDGGGREGSVRGPAAGFGGDLGCSGGFASLPGLCMVLSIAPWGLRAPLALHRQPAGRARRARSRFAPGFGVPGTPGCCRHRSGPNARGWVLPLQCSGAGAALQRAACSRLLAASAPVLGSHLVLLVLCTAAGLPCIAPAPVLCSSLLPGRSMLPVHCSNTLQQLAASWVLQQPRCIPCVLSRCFPAACCLLRVATVLCSSSVLPEHCTGFAVSRCFPCIAPAPCSSLMLPLD